MTASADAVVRYLSWTTVTENLVLTRTDSLAVSVVLVLQSTRTMSGRRLIITFWYLQSCLGTPDKYERILSNRNCLIHHFIYILLTWNSANRTQQP